MVRWSGGQVVRWLGDKVVRWSGGQVAGWTPSPNPKGLNMNRPDTIHESAEPEGFEYEMMIAGKMIFDPVRGRAFSHGVRVLFTFDAFSIRETGRL